MKYTPRLPEKNHNVSQVSPLHELFILLGSLLAIVAVIYLLLGYSVGLLISRISPETEQKIAGLFLNKFDTKERQNTKVVYLQKLVDRMKEKGCISLPYPVTVHLVDSKTVNAVALPGGHIIIFSSLLDIVKSENELSFVLGHEIGHFKNKDHLSSLGRGLIFATLSALLLPADNGIGHLIAKTVQITETGFSREQESAADAFGLQDLYCSYGHINGAIQFFNHMPENLDPGRLGHYFSSHPDNEKRINGLQELTRKKGYTEGRLIPLAIPDR